jgi:hypothetical protein
MRGFYRIPADSRTLNKEIAYLLKEKIIGFFKKNKFESCRYPTLGNEKVAPAIQL